MKRNCMQDFFARSRTWQMKPPGQACVTTGYLDSCIQIKSAYYLVKFIDVCSYVEFSFDLKYIAVN